MICQNDDIKIEIHWVYEPQDYFEEKVLYEFDNCSIEIESGHIIARTSAVVFDSMNDLPSLLGQKIYSYFLGAQLIR